MKPNTHACIAYMVGRLVGGKSIVSIYDFFHSREIAVRSLPDAHRLDDFTYVNWSYMVSEGKPSRKIEYVFSTGQSLEISVKGNTFIGQIRETGSHFVGRVRDDTVNIFDMKEAIHFNYKLILEKACEKPEAAAATLPGAGRQIPCRRG